MTAPQPKTFKLFWTSVDGCPPYWETLEYSHDGKPGEIVDAIQLLPEMTGVGEALSLSGEKLHEYVDKMSQEKESLCAKFIAETGLKPSEIVLCEAPSKDGYGRSFFFDRLENVDPRPTPKPLVAEHSDDQAVDRFAIAMKEKLAHARAKGRHGWETCRREALSQMLREHVEKGDPRDVANFCMMLHQLGWAIAPTPSAWRR